jgi:hypothetical protein
MTFNESIHNPIEADDANKKDKGIEVKAPWTDKNESPDSDPSLQGQLPHRVKDKVVKGMDSNFPRLK